MKVQKSYNPLEQVFISQINLKQEEKYELILPNPCLNLPSLPDTGIVAGRLRHFHSQEERLAGQQAAGRLHHRCNCHPDAPCFVGIP